MNTQPFGQMVECSFNIDDEMKKEIKNLNSKSNILI